jgi:hypothetical protein
MTTLHLYSTRGHASVRRQLGGCGEGWVVRVYRESVGRVIDKKTKELIVALLSCPDVKSEWKIFIALGYAPRRMKPPRPFTLH